MHKQTIIQALLLLFLATGNIGAMVLKHTAGPYAGYGSVQMQNPYGLEQLGSATICSSWRSLKPDSFANVSRLTIKQDEYASESVPMQYEYYTEANHPGSHLQTINELISKINITLIPLPKPSNSAGMSFGFAAGMPILFLIFGRCAAHYLNINNIKTIDAQKWAYIIGGLAGLALAIKGARQYRKLNSQIFEPSDELIEETRNCNYRYHDCMIAGLTTLVLKANDDLREDKILKPEHRARLPLLNAQKIADLKGLVFSPSERILANLAHNYCSEFKDARKYETLAQTIGGIVGAGICGKFVYEKVVR